eukprot:102330-Alexandrium_andersonii.AAC.1
MSPPAPSMSQGQGKSAPELPCLAWVPWEPEDPNSERCLRRLLCNRWVQEAEHHTGTFASPHGSKEHERRLRDIDVNAS